MTTIAPAAFARRAALALVAAALLMSAPAEAARGGADWGPYAQLVGTTWSAPGGFPRKAWRWSDDGQSILEIELSDAYGKPRITTLKPNKKGDALVAIGPDGGRRKAKFGVDGSVLWSAEGMDDGGTRVVVQNGALVEQEVKVEGGRPKKVKDETRFASSNDTAWVESALGGKKKGGKKEGGKFADLFGKNKDRGKGPATPQPTAPAPQYAPPPAYTSPAPVPPPAPSAQAQDAGMSLDCAMAPPEVRARGCKPPSATTPAPSASSGSTAGGAAGGSGAQVLEVNGQRWPVSRAFPDEILGRYLYEKRGEPIVELRRDGTGLFQPHMVPPIQIRWWLKAGANGAPEKITGYQGNYRYTVVLQYVNSTNGNYPSGGYDSWYLDTDLAAGCSIILGERFKCR